VGVYDGWAPKTLPVWGLRALSQKLFEICHSFGIFGGGTQQFQFCANPTGGPGEK